MIVTKSFYVDTTKGLDLINVTHEVRRVVREANMQDGNLTIVVPNPGAAVVAMEIDENVIGEIRKGLEPFLASGLIRCLLPKSLAMTVEKGKMSIEPWQGICLVDYDTSAKRREFRVQAFSEPPPPEVKGKGIPIAR